MDSLTQTLMILTKIHPNAAHSQIEAAKQIRLPDKGVVLGVAA